MDLDRIHEFPYVQVNCLYVCGEELMRTRVKQKNPREQHTCIWINRKLEQSSRKKERWIISREWNIWSMFTGILGQIDPTV